MLHAVRDLLVVAVAAHAPAVGAGEGANAVEQVPVKVVAPVGVPVDPGGPGERGREGARAADARVGEADAGAEVREEVGHCRLRWRLL